MMMFFRPYFYFILSGLLMLPHALTQAQVQGQIADQLSRGLYCKTFELLAGDLGIILGLLIGFIGFLILIFKQMNVTGFVMIIGGVCLTALPYFLETTLANMTAMTSASGMGNRVFNAYDDGRRHLGDCSLYDNIQLEFIEQSIISGGMGDGGLDRGAGGDILGGAGSNSSIEGMIDHILQVEGGYVNHPDDRGGPTNFGITQATLSAYLGRPATIADVQNLSVSTARAIYRNQYAPSASTPQHLQAIVFDSNVNHGHGGQSTIMNNATRLAGGGTPSSGHYMQARINYYVGIIRRNPSQMSFADGWTNRMREFGYSGPEIRNLI